MRKYARVAVAAVAVLSAFAIAGVASAGRVRNCDGCLVGVAADGSLLGSRGVVSSSRLSVGYYEVVFRRTVAGCAISATQVVADGSSTALAYVSAGLVAGRPNVLRYYVLNPAVRIPASGFVDSTFTSTLTCLG